MSAPIVPVTDVVTTPLIDAAFRGQVHYVVELLAGGADVNETSEFGETALHAAAGANHVDVMRVLLDADAACGAMVKWTGFTPLHEAAHKGNVEAVECLVAAGADLEATDSQGRTPLHVAVESRARSVRLVEQLLQANASLSAICHQGRTPLHTAVHAIAVHAPTRDEGDVVASHEVAVSHEIVSTLAYWGADVNRRDYDGNTALHLAIHADGAAALVDTLLLLGATPIYNNCDQTPLDVALSKLDTPKANMLRELLHNERAAWKRDTRKHSC